MRAVDLAMTSLDMSYGWVMGLAQDAKDVPLTAPTPKGGNHPTWCLGHLAFSEGNLIHQYAKGGANPLADWEPLFGQGSQPVADASKYPSYDELLAKVAEMRAATKDYVASLSDEDLSKPSHAPEEMKEWFGTVAQCLIAAAVHFTYHGGQIADARRAAGKPVLMG